MLAADEEVSNDHETLPGTRGSEERERTHPRLKEEERRTVAGTPVWLSRYHRCVVC